MLKLYLECKRQQLSESIKYREMRPSGYLAMLALWFVCALYDLRYLSAQLVEQSRLSYGRTRKRAR